MSVIREKSGVSGRLHISVYREGKELFTFDDHNLVVTGGKSAMAKLVAGEDAENNKVTQVGVGVSTVEATEADTELTDPANVEIDEARVGANLEDDEGGTFEDPHTVQFHFTIGREEAVGKAIAEYGLLTAGGALFSRVVREKPFEKTNMDRIVGFWQIKFV